MTLNLPRIESICRLAAVVIWSAGAIGKVLFTIADSQLSTGMFSLLAGLACWGASYVLPGIFSIFKLPPPPAPKS